MLLVTDPVPFCPLSFSRESTAAQQERTARIWGYSWFQQAVKLVLNTLSEGFLILFLICGCFLLSWTLHLWLLHLLLLLSRPCLPACCCTFPWNRSFFVHVTSACSRRFLWSTQIPDNVSPNPTLWVGLDYNSFSVRTLCLFFLKLTFWSYSVSMLMGFKKSWARSGNSGLF